jgi:hypothetical protein
MMGWHWLIPSGEDVEMLSVNKQLEVIRIEDCVCSAFDSSA